MSYLATRALLPSFRTALPSRALPRPPLRLLSTRDTRFPAASTISSPSPLSSIVSPAASCSAPTVPRHYSSTKPPPKPTKMSATPVQDSIESKLKVALDPVEHLLVENESYKHAVPKGSETHFKVVAVSSAFLGKTLLARHRLVNEALKFELSNGVHALSIQAKTPDEWAASGGSVHSTPSCLGGEKRAK